MSSFIANILDVSIILNAHREGRLAHRSVRSARRAIDFARRRNVSVELLAILDRPDPQTSRYFAETPIDFAGVVTVDYGDLGLSRNHGVRLARGRYVCFLDADDLFSENWVEQAFRNAEAQRDTPVVLHPEFNVVFGRELAVSRHVDSTQPGFEELSLLQFNYWSALSFVSREFFLNGNQYAPTDLASQFGFEDWLWNCQTLANGADHRPVPGTAHFIRLKESGSLVEQTKHSRAVIRPSRLFDDGVMAHRQENTQQVGDEKPPVAVQRRGRMAATQVLFCGYRVLQRLKQRCEPVQPRWCRFLDELTNAGRRYLTPSPTVPDWLLDEWRTISDIEPELSPTPQVLRALQRALRPQSVAARRYPELSRAYGAAATHVFFVPDLCDQPSHRLLWTQLSAILASDECERVVCLMAEYGEATLPPLPSGVEQVSLSQHLAGLVSDEQDMLLVRLLLQKPPREIHVIASSIGYRLLRNFAPALASQSNLVVSLTDADGLCENGSVGEAVKTLPRCFERLTRVYTDDERTVDELCELFAFERDRFRVLGHAVAPAKTTRRLPVAA